MTCIVFSAGVMAADSLLAANGTRHGTMRKIARSPSGTLGGAGGGCAAVEQFLKQVEAGLLERFALDLDDQGFVGMLAHADGTLHCVSATGLTWPILSGFAAIGTGADVALGALHMGATAREAVEAAIAFDTNCGGAIQIELLDNGAIRPAPVKQWDVT